MFSLTLLHTLLNARLYWAQKPSALPKLCGHGGGREWKA